MKWKEIINKMKWKEIINKIKELENLKIKEK